MTENASSEATRLQLDFSSERLSDTDITIFPSWREGEVGVYREQLIELAKSLRREGVEVRWLDDSEYRTWYGERSALSDALLSIGLGILTNAGWDAIKLVLGRRRGPVKLKIVYREEKDGTRVRQLEVEGDSADMPKLLDKALSWRDPDDNDGPRSGQKEIE